MKTMRISAAVLLAAGLWLSPGCGGGGGGDDGGCDGTCPQPALTSGDVSTILAQGASEAQALGIAVTIAVTDRVGNVLGVFRMDGAPGTTRITSRRGVASGLEGVDVPSSLAAISKAGTGAYLSSQGNAFTSRTASQIVQEHFNPGERGRPGGPLFGVQFSQLPCGDVVTLGGSEGPRPMPLGLSADPGGLPLFKDSLGPDLRAPVGGVGVEGVVELPEGMALYRTDPIVTDRDDDLEERIAAAAARGFAAPTNRRANRITVDGKSLRFTDAGAGGTGPVLPLAEIPGSLVAAPPFTDGTLRGGVALGTAESGIVATEFAGQPAEVLPRFPVRGSSVGGGPNAGEVQAILANALALTFRTRAQIRRPLGTPARVSIAVVDVRGTLLGLVRSPDAPIFGIDVAVQKARTASFFSSPGAADDLNGAGFGSYVSAVRQFLGDPNALTGGFAFSDRAGGNLSRPLFPDGIDGNANGPLSRPIGDWSPFSTGLQTDLVAGALAQALGGSVASSCTAVSALPNGIQIFPGSVPIYRGGTLVGGIGISGDGVDQDDLFAFLGLHQAGLELGGALGNAPPGIRADQISVAGSNLRFVNCPVRPFIGSNEQGVCDGL